MGLGASGWRLAGSKRTYDLNEIDEEKHRGSVFYKEQWVEIKGLRQRMLGELQREVQGLPEKHTGQADQPGNGSDPVRQRGAVPYKSK